MQKTHLDDSGLVTQEALNFILECYPSWLQRDSQILRSVDKRQFIDIR